MFVRLTNLIYLETIYIMAKYMNLNANAMPPYINNETIMSRVMNAGKNMMTSNNMLIIGVVVLFLIIACVYYYYYIRPSMKTTYHHNNEVMSSEKKQTAELMFFYADWCPHCKEAKPIWNDIKSEYENKTINNYKILFTDVNCSEETPEVDKLLDQFSVEGFPTIKLIKDGQVVEYDAKPSKENLTKFLNTVL